jgi:hypothetical protein
MQIRWLTGLWRVTLEPIKKSRTSRQTTRDNVADESLAFHDRDIRLAGNGHEIIGSIAPQRAGCSKMKWNGNLMHSLSIQFHWPDATTKVSR